MPGVISICWSSTFVTMSHLHPGFDLSQFDVRIISAARPLHQRYSDIASKYRQALFLIASVTRERFCFS